MLVELVRDQFSLAAMTGLPEEAARTTGTLAVANWGRVTMVTPRSINSSYRWMDTLAHELAHVVLSMGTRDRAPLWLQEGVAKYFETRWRIPDSFDDYPSSDAIASAGFDLGLARNFDEIGPSVAMLPSPKDAMVVYAQVESFVRFLMREVGEQVLTELVPRLREALEDEGASEVLVSMTGRDLASWQESWRVWLQSSPWSIPNELSREQHAPDPLVMRNARLGRLLIERRQGRAALLLLDQARVGLPDDLQLRYLQAKAYLQGGSSKQAWDALELVEPRMSPHAEAFALRGRMQASRGEEVNAEVEFFRGLSFNPWSPEVACEGLDAPELPSIAARYWLCRAARTFPRY